MKGSVRVVSPSGWCQSAAGTKPDAGHEECERRLREGLLGACGCPEHEVESARGEG